MDGVRDHAKLGALAATGWLAEAESNIAAALANLESLTTTLGRRREAQRLFVN